jgi:hypothetical protein
MFYSIGIITVVRAGRSMNGDWAWIANEWYAFHLRLFPIGVMLASFSLIFGYFGLRLSQYIEVKKTTISQLFFAILSVVFILLTTLYSTIFQWERGPDIKNWLQQKQFALLLPGLINQEVNLWPLDQVNDARKYLSDNKLSVFSSRTEKEIFENSHGGILRLNNWYGDDWIGGAGALVFRQSKAGLLEFSYEIPNFISDSLIKITLNDELAFTGMVPSGQKKTFLGKTGPGINILKIESNREVIPKSVNANSDIRPLSLRVSEIKF